MGWCMLLESDYYILSIAIFADSAKSRKVDEKKASSDGTSYYM